jgi:hypothetical protein
MQPISFLAQLAQATPTGPASSPPLGPASHPSTPPGRLRPPVPLPLPFNPFGRISPVQPSMAHLAHLGRLPPHNARVPPPSSTPPPSQSFPIATAIRPPVQSAAESSAHHLLCSARNIAPCLIASSPRNQQNI